MSDELEILATQTRIYASFDRAISLNYNTWKFAKGASRNVPIADEAKETAKMHWMCVRYVYTAMMAALPRIRRVAGERPDIVAQLDLIEWEATDGLTQAETQLVGLA